MITVTCIDDRNRPNEIPLNKWIKKGETYTVIDIVKCNTQAGAVALILEEIDLSGCDPYKGFYERRFNLTGEYSFEGSEVTINYESK